MKKKMFYIGWIVVMVGILLLSISLSFWYIGLIIDVLLVGTIIWAIITQKKQRFCSKCKHQFDFESEVAYQEVDRRIKTYKYNANSNSNHQLKESLTYKIEFRCTCAECGTEKTYRKTIAGPRVYYDGDYVDEDPEYYIESYFREGELAGTTGKTIFIEWMAGIGLILAAILVFIFGKGLGITSIGEDLDIVGKGPDPADYYGTYYSEYDYEYRSFTFNSNKKCEYYEGNGTTSNSTQTLDYDYVSAEYAVNKLGSEAMYNNKDAIFIYKGSSTAIVLWVMNSASDNYEFEINSIGARVSKKKYTIGDATDVSSFYGTYKYNDRNYLVVNSDGTANFTLNGTTTSYQYILASSGYMQRWITSGIFGKSILLYHKGNSSCQVFEVSGISLKYGDSIFTKV